MDNIVPPTKPILLNFEKNNTNYPSVLYKELEQLYNNNDENIKKNLFEYQRYVYNIMTQTDNRGILIYHGVGSGKTITSISIAEEFRKLDRDIIIISSKSLQSNYKKEINTFNKKINPEIHDDELEEITSKYKFVTSNSKNMIKSLEDPLHNFMENVNNINLENKVIIIDEVHNLFNSISNGSKIANEFYEIIMNTKKIKLIFLTGTPIINDPFEIAICFNLLYGPIKSSNGPATKHRKKEYSTILPEYYTDFKQYFIDDYHNTIKNENKFQNRIFGLVSYYGDMYFEKQSTITEELKQTKKKENYPDRYPIKFEIIEMSQIQNIEYYKARDIERRENSKFSSGSSEFSSGGAIIREKNLVSTSYRIKSRQLSNIYVPSNIKLEKYNFNKYSPKMEKIYNNINKNHKDTISLVYSTFLDSGILAFSKLLELNEYVLYNPVNEYDETKKYYAIFSGGQTIEEKEDILKRLNLEENKHGKLISMLLISKSGAEGLDLKNIRSVHIMEPYWNFSLIEQIIARAVRYKSHINLPEDEQNVQVYIYLADYNKQFLENEKEKLKEKIKKTKKSKDNSIELTTDINMFKNAIKNQELIYKFLKCIASTSIECPMFNKKKLNYNCFNCIGNNKELYYNDIHKDIMISDSCIRTTTQKVEEIILNDIKYYYNILDNGNIKVYKYNDVLEGYTNINNIDIIEKIKKNIK